jgi:hypothetical protein
MAKIPFERLRARWVSIGSAGTQLSDDSILGNKNKSTKKTGNEEKANISLELRNTDRTGRLSASEPMGLFEPSLLVS